MVRADCDEHGRAATPGVCRAASRDVYQEIERSAISCRPSADAAGGKGLDVDVIINASRSQATRRSTLIDRDACLRLELFVPELHGIELDRGHDAVIGHAAMLETYPAARED